MANQKSVTRVEQETDAVVKGLTVGLLQENCYIFGCRQSGKAVVIDPGDNARAILKVVRDSDLKLERIINTHAHFDHVMAVNAIRATTGIPFFVCTRPICQFCAMFRSGYVSGSTPRRSRSTIPMNS